MIREGTPKKQLKKTKKEKRERRIRSGVGIGNIVIPQDEKSFKDFVDTMKCDQCHQVFSFTTDKGTENLCMNCYMNKFGSDKTQQQYMVLSEVQRKGWETPVSQDKIRKTLIRKRVGEQKMQEIVQQFIASSVDVLIFNKGIEVCKEGKCSNDYDNVASYQNNILLDDLKTCTYGLVQELQRKDDFSIEGLTTESYMRDPEFVEVLQEELVDQLEGINQYALSYLKYLMHFYLHFKHTTYNNDMVGSFNSNKVFDLRSMKEVKCPFTDPTILDDDTSLLIIKFSKLILSNVDYYQDGRTDELNAFKLDFDHESEMESLATILQKFHVLNKCSEEEMWAMNDKNLELVEKLGYETEWKIIKDDNLTLVYCDKCRVFYRIKKSSVKYDPPISERKEKTLGGSDVKHEKKIQKIKKEKPKFLEVDKAILKLAEMNIKNQGKLDKAKKKGHATNIPKNPNRHYGGKFSWKLVREIKRKKKDRSYDDVELAIKNLRSHWKFYMRKPDAFFITLFDDWGLFDLKDPYKQRFFSEFVTLRHTVAGRQQLLEALSSGRFDMMFGHFPRQVPSSSSVNLASPHTSLYSTDVTNTEDEFSFAKLLEDEREAGVHQILSETNSLIPMDKDSRAFKLHVRMIIQELWLAVMKEGEREVSEIKKYKIEANSVLGNTVISTFMAEFSLIKILKAEIIHSDYRGEEPNMMQLYTAFMIQARRGFGNFSSTGSGKTKSVVLGSRLSGAKNTLIFTPAPVMKQFGDMILADYPLSYISISKHSKDKIFPEAPIKKAFRYHIMNYEKISRDEQADDLINRICETDVDMVIFDEAHLFKQRDEKEQSNTRKNIEILLERLRENKPKLKAVFLTATPIINNLTEGVKLLEMIANKKYPHLKTTNHVRNGSRLYMELLQYSLRYIRDYKINLHEIEVETQAYLPNTWDSKQVRSMNYSGWEILCTPTRVPEIVKIVKKHGKAIIYTDYVSRVVDQLKEGLEKEGIKVGTFTGQKDGKEGLVKKTEVRGETTNPFANGDIDVLIASSPIALGIDGLQKICNCMIFNGLTWTWGKYEQIIGRLEREGQTEKDVYIYKILTSIESFEYDKKIRLERIYYKHMIQMCAIDGKIPDLNSWKNHEIKSKKGYQDFLETILRDRRTRVQTRAELRKAGVQEMEE